MSTAIFNCKYCAVDFYERKLHGNFWVKEKHRRQSIGTKLMQHAEDIARNKGHKAVFLEHDWRDTAEYVREWYERTGYTEIGFNNEGVTLMKKTL